MSPIQMDQLFSEVAEKIVQASGNRLEPLMQFSCIVPKGSLSAIYEYTARIYGKPVMSRGNMASVKYRDCITVSETRTPDPTQNHAEPCDDSGQTVRRAAYQRAHKLLDLHELGYAVREYCMPEDEFRFVWHGKKYLTICNVDRSTDTVVVQGEVCMHYAALKKFGELA